MENGGICQFIELLEREGELHRVEREVDPDLEIAEVSRRAAGEGKALLFQRVKGSSFPLTTGLFGSFRRVCLALGGAPADLQKRIAAALPADGTPDDSFPAFLSRFSPLAAEGAPRVEEPVDLRRIPFLRSWPGDGGSYLTLPMVFTRDPDSGKQNCGIYRVQRLDRERVAIAWKKGSGGASHAARSAGRMPVALVLGADPAVTFAAGFSFPRRADELEFAGMLRGKRVETVPCRSCGLSVPAQAGVVIEGYLEPGEMATEGPFGNHTGYYAEAQQVPVMRVTCITRGPSPIVAAAVPGPPPSESSWMARGWQALILPYLRRLFPELVALDLPAEGIFHRGAVFSLLPGSDGRSFLQRVAETEFFRGSRLLVAVDAEVDPSEYREVYWRGMNSAFPPSAAGGVLAIDATAAGRRRTVPDPATAAAVGATWDGYGL